MSSQLVYFQFHILIFLYTNAAIFFYKFYSESKGKVLPLLEQVAHFDLIESFYSNEYLIYFLLTFLFYQEQQHQFFLQYQFFSQSRRKYFFPLIYN